MTEEEIILFIYRGGVLGTLVSLPVIGALVGAGLFFVIVFESVPLLIGALIGGALAEWQSR
jgi:mannitol-specific phosphotransferase system IIBC component